MATKRHRRTEEIREKKKKRSTRIIYISVVLAGVVVLLISFFVILFNALFPPVDSDALKRKEKRLAIIYFSDLQERFLLPEKRYVYSESDLALQAKEIVNALLDGSKTRLVNTFPTGVTVKNVKVTKEGTALVSFSRNLTTLHPGGSTAEMATIYSLTNSIVENVAGIKKVKILVEGSEIQSIKGHISTKKEFVLDREMLALVKEERS